MRNMEIGDLAKEAHEISKSKGWYDEHRSVGDFLVLIHSEVSEALEEFRNRRIGTWFSTDKKGNQKPEGFGVELVDILIRVFDLAEYKGIDLEELLNLKMDYNKTRDRKHGGKVI